MVMNSLVSEYSHIKIMTADLPNGLSGLYYDNIILLNKHLKHNEKHCVLAEEIGHYETTYGNIIDLQDIRNKKLELTARRWGYEKIVPLEKLIECNNNEFWTIDDICFHLEITPKYLEQALKHYSQKYGLYKNHGDYKIIFNPLNIVNLRR